MGEAGSARTALQLAHFFGDEGTYVAEAWAVYTLGDSKSEYGSNAD